MSTIDTEFRCPCCDGKTYSNVDPVRMCRGSIFAVASNQNVFFTTCDFSWPKDDDWKYIRLVIKASYAGDKGPEIAKEAAIDHFMERGG